MTHYDNPSLYKNGQMIVRVGNTGNVFNLSSLTDFEHSMVSHCFAIKFVRDGIERYTINNHSYTVNSGSYLLMNGQKEGKVVIDSNRPVKGMCLNISNDLITEVVSTLQVPDTAVSDPDLAKFFYTEDFLENQYRASHTQLGQKLQQISEQVTNHSFSNEQVNQEFFFQLAESLVSDQVRVFKQLQSIKTVKTATQRDLCRRVLRGKEFMDSNFAETLSIESIARMAGMSEYHFFRLFKQMTGLTPYQYILSNRLNKAALLLKKDYSVSDIAITTGFADIHSFSKMFKKHFGVSPTIYSSNTP
ncbi:AraC family transcriptional regulator [Fluviicola sp.]|uniref:AraC family transcriptional regulator n=1 Tax=Fluviicola sp. TaxID=1917219 RepID=UPI0031DB0F61